MSLEPDLIDVFDLRTAPWMQPGVVTNCRPISGTRAEISKQADRWSAPTGSRSTALCNGCPIRVACLKWALDNSPGEGIYGGTTDEQRAEIRKLRDQNGAAA